MAVSKIPFTIDRALKEIGAWDGVTNIKGFEISVSPNAKYKYINGIIFSRQGTNAFKVNSNWDAVPSGTVEHILGDDTFTITVSGRTITFEASTTWNDMTLLFSTSFVDGEYSVTPLAT